MEFSALSAPATHQKFKEIIDIKKDHDMYFWMKEGEEMKK